MLRSILMIVVFLPALVTAKEKWTYENMKSWSQDAHYCQGNRQSPIDLRFNLSRYDSRLKRIELQQMNSPNLPHLTNNGHTAQLHLNGTYVMKNVAPCSGDYVVEQLHFHWGYSENSTNGSEHLLETESYPLELHVVSYSKSFSSIKDAMSNVRGLAVIGVFFELSDESNEHLQPIIAALEHIHRHSAQHLVSDHFNLRSLFGEEGIRRYYRYDGSLTTPPCYESVIWTVLQKPLKISLDQLNAFRRLHDDQHKLMNNTYRPTQPLGARKLFRSFRSNEMNNEPEERQIIRSGNDGNYASTSTRVFFAVISLVIWMIN